MPVGGGLTSGIDGHKVKAELRPRKYRLRFKGSDAILVQHYGFLSAGSGSRRARSSSIPARPYICRFSILSRFMCPSTGPLLHGLLTADSTALTSCFKVPTNTTSEAILSF